MDKWNGWDKIKNFGGWILLWKGWIMGSGML